MTSTVGTSFAIYFAAFTQLLRCFLDFISKLPKSNLQLVQVPSAGRNLPFFFASCDPNQQASSQRWYLTIYYENGRKPLPEKRLKFESLEDAKKFLAHYFECPIEDGKLPAPDL